MKKIIISVISLVILSTSNYAWFWDNKTDQKSVITGKALMPVENIYIYVYKEGTDPHGPPYTISEATNTNGEFRLELPDGSYFL